MAVWKDPLTPRIVIPSDLEKQWFQLGSKKFQLLSHQYELLAAKEELIVMMGGYGCAKTDGGVKKIAHLAMHPNNRIIVGRNSHTDLVDTTQRDLMDFLWEAQLVKTAPNSKNKTCIVHCVDPRTQQNLGYTSEINFQHLDNPEHLRGRHIGVYWIDEASEVKLKAHLNLQGRMRLPAFAGKYQALITGNPAGRNWCFDLGFNEESLIAARCKNPKHSHGTSQESNQCVRLKRRAIHARSIDNYFLPDDYIDNMLANYTPMQIKRYMDGEFDVFEGAVFGEFDNDMHILRAA